MSSHGKANKSCSKISRVTITGSELIVGKLHGKELIAHDRTPALARNSDEQELLNSLSWIQRWLHNGSATAQKRPQPVVACDPQVSKLELATVTVLQVSPPDTVQDEENSALA
ncbi:hypothetical protein K7X08_006998 [Anisodus acutangulus]|uniref:Uncharacterized protein n=1 Tax=Anisodus acutangulus TaxID=402998 RepID=A0A9Q1R159_9SOLA|nr:hypothetical protein K7X08_006998 [Anisodus acutangulus]